MYICVRVRDRTSYKNVYSFISGSLWKKIQVLLNWYMSSVSYLRRTPKYKYACHLTIGERCVVYSVCTVCMSMCVWLPSVQRRFYWLGIECKSSPLAIRTNNVLWDTPDVTVIENNLLFSVSHNFCDPLEKQFRLPTKDKLIKSLLYVISSKASIMS